MKSSNPDKTVPKREPSNQEGGFPHEAEPVVSPLGEEELASVAGGKTGTKYAFDTGDQYVEDQPARYT